MKNRTPILSLALALMAPLFFGACADSCAPATRSGDLGAGGASEPDRRDRTERVDPTEVPSPPEAPQANAPVSHPEQARIDGILAAMSEAQEAAAQAEGETHCERAYDGNRRFAAALREQTGGEPLPPDTPAGRARFVALCDDLSEPVQRCLVTSYTVAHREECAEVRATMSEESQEALRRLMADLGPLSSALGRGEN